MQHVKSPYCNDMLFTRRHSVSQLVPNRTSIKVRFTQPHRLGWKYTHSSPAQRRVSRSGGLQMFSVPQQLLELQWSVSPEWRRAEAQRNKNRMEHEVTLKALESAAPQTAGPANSLWAKMKSTQDRIKGARWWLIWISSFSCTGLFLHWYFTPRQRSNIPGPRWLMLEQGTGKGNRTLLLFLECH